MSTYPQLIFPKTILTILKKDKYERTKEPIRPKEPIWNSYIPMKMTILILGIVIFLFKPLLSMVIIALALLWLIKNPEKITYEKDFSTYKTLLAKYDYDYKKFIYENKLTPERFTQVKRKEEVRAELLKAVVPDEERDYKKGLSHDFFKKYLFLNFGDKIKEDCCLRVSRRYQINLSSYRGEMDESLVERRPYVSDFAYCDMDTKLFIGIEIDEPYTLGFVNEPIHLYDNERNDFFGKHNWVTIRFAEEQILTYPELCCKLIRDVRTCLIDDFSFKYPYLIKCDIPNIPTFSKENVKAMIVRSYREKYLEKYKLN